METKNKNALIGGLLAVVFVMAVGYAAFATQLNINGTANITSTWDVHIQSITAGTPVGTASNTSATVVDNENAEFVTDLKAPGDSLTYSVEVINNGSLPAKLSTITLTQTHGNDAVPDTENGIADTRTIIYSYAEIAEGEVLAAGATKTFTVTVKYNDAITDDPCKGLAADSAECTAKKQSVLDLHLNYVQDTTSETTGE